VEKSPLGKDRSDEKPPKFSISNKLFFYKFQIFEDKEKLP
jgi:hypothetical protein